MRCPHCRGSGRSDPELVTATAPALASVLALRPRSGPLSDHQDDPGYMAPVIDLSARRMRRRAVNGRTGPTA